MNRIALCATLGTLFLLGSMNARGQSTAPLAFTSVSLKTTTPGLLTFSISTSAPAKCEITALPIGISGSILYSDLSFTTQRSGSITLPSDIQKLSGLPVSIRATSSTGVTIYSNLILTLPSISQPLSVTKFTATALSKNAVSVECVTTLPATLQVLASIPGVAETTIFSDGLQSTSHTLWAPLPATLQAAAAVSVRARLVGSNGALIYSGSVQVPLPSAGFTVFKAAALSRSEIEFAVGTSTTAPVTILASAAGFPETQIAALSSADPTLPIRAPIPETFQRFASFTVRAKMTPAGGGTVYSSPVVVIMPAIVFTTFKAAGVSRSEIQFEVATSAAASIVILASASGVPETQVLSTTSSSVPKTVVAKLPLPFEQSSTVNVRARIAARTDLSALSGTITVALPKAIAGELLTSFEVKEVAGVGAKDFPVRMVVPLPKGRYQSTDTLLVVDQNSVPIPSTVTPLTRYWADDQSVRFAAVDFLATVSAFAGAGTGKTTYNLLKAQTSPPPAAAAVSAIESGTTIEITNDQLKLVINKAQFRLISEAYLDANRNGLFEESERLIANSGGGALFQSAWGTQYNSAARTDVRYTVEENGPVRVVVKAEAPTRYIDMMRYEPGFAVRLYVYARSPFVKLDYQLQAGALNAVYAGPLYFDELSLDFDTPLASNNTRVTVGLQGAAPWSGELGSGISLRQLLHNQAQLFQIGQASAFAQGTMASGYMDVSTAKGGVTAFIRDFWQTWPNGLEAAPNASGTRIRLQPFPEWGDQLVQNTTLSTKQMFWLDDMMATYKETYLYLHPPAVSATDLQNLTATLQHAPVAVLPYQWYRQTRGVGSLGQFLPGTGVAAPTDSRLPDYSKAASAALGQKSYRYGWINYGELEPGFRDTPCTAGGLPYGQLRFMMSGDPRDYYVMRSAALAELNTRPEWLSGYTYGQNWPMLQLSDNGYCNGSWRKHISNAVPKLAYPYLAGTVRLKGARDDEHGWFYHMEEAYYLTGDPWIRDWYGFVGEYRKTRLNQKDPYPDRSSRATGHSLAHALQAWRVTGDSALLAGLQGYIDKYLRPFQDLKYGDQSKKVEPMGGGYQTGFLAGVLTDYMTEIEDVDKPGFARTFAYLTGLIEWNFNYGNFPYYFNAMNGGTGQSSGTAATLLDPVSWYANRFGKKRYFDHALQFALYGINGGIRPYIDTNAWKGDHDGRVFIDTKVGAPITPTSLPGVTGISGARTTSGFSVSWPAIYGAKRYLVFYSPLPISIPATIDPSLVNWWACDVVSVDATSRSGSTESVTLNSVQAGPLFVTILAMDDLGKLTEPSNVATLQ